MAIARVECTCSACGKAFEVRRQCANRRDAMHYESWAADNRSFCNACYAEAMAKRKEREVSDKLGEWGLTLPTIKGVSGKQVAYAVNVRARYLGKRLLTDVAACAECLIRIRDDRESLEAEFSALGITLEEAWARALAEHISLKLANIALTCESAREIIDNLSHE